MKAGKHAEAITKFNEVIAKCPNCADCYYNIGVRTARSRTYPEAETAFKKVIELKPDAGEALHGPRPTSTTPQKKFDLAAEASGNASKILRRRRRRRRSQLQPGRGALQRRQVRRSEAGVRGRGEGRPDDGDCLLPARDDRAEPGPDSGGRDGARGATSRPTRTARRPPRSRRRFPPCSRCSRSKLVRNVHRRPADRGPRPHRGCGRGRPAATPPPSGSSPFPRPFPSTRLRSFPRRTARLRGEPRAGGPTEDRGFGRHFHQVASTRPPADEQGPKGGAGRSPMVQSIDGIELLQKLDAAAAEAHHTLELLHSGGPGRRGHEVRRFAGMRCPDSSKPRGGLVHAARVVGLMTLPPAPDTPEEAAAVDFDGCGSFKTNGWAPGVPRRRCSPSCRWA